jgi:hypothetical protein
MYRLTIQQYLILLATALIWGACAKAKPEFSTSGNLVTSQQIASSSVRLVNLYGYTDLRVNGQALTDMAFPTGFGQIILPLPTVFFPTTGKLGQTYEIPQQFINAQHTAMVEVEVVTYASSAGQDSIIRKFQVTDNYAQPNDYYVVPVRLPGATIGGQVFTDSVIAIPRAVSPAADPTHILVRVLNLSTGPDAANLQGAMRLAYADGTHVATGAADSLVSPGSSSAYMELPYGTYQFKVLTAQNNQVPSAQQDMPPMTIVQSSGMIYAAPPAVQTALTYAPIVSFQPGGVYTIVVNANNNFNIPYGTGTLDASSNSFWVIPDIAPAANVTYARMQVANAVPGSSITVSVDGQPLGKPVAYPGTGSYQVYVNGSHTVQATDQGGKLLAQKTLTLNGGDNITAWVYPAPGGTDSILPVQNNLSGNWYPGNTTDGSNASINQFHTSFPFWIRFLNLCPDLPLVTFTQANGQLFPEYLVNSGGNSLAAENLAPGVLPDTYLQYIGVYNTMPPQIEAYQSQPQILPGDWLSDIPSLKASGFVMSTAASYPGGLPATGEPGVYTVALVGRYGTNAPAGEQAKMIIIKHNQ